MYRKMFKRKANLKFKLSILRISISFVLLCLRVTQKALGLPGFLLSPPSRRRFRNGLTKVFTNVSSFVTREACDQCQTC